MTITFDNHEWQDHVSDIDKMRYKRERLMEQCIKDVLGREAESEEIMRLYRKKINDDWTGGYNYPSPIFGMKLNAP